MDNMDSMDDMDTSIEGPLLSTASTMSMSSTTSIEYSRTILAILCIFLISTLDYYYACSKMNHNCSKEMYHETH